MGSVAMQEKPFSQDWRFWEIAVADLGALLGFLGGTGVRNRSIRRGV